MNKKWMKAGLCLTLIALGLAIWIHFQHPFRTAIEWGQLAKLHSDISFISQSLLSYKDCNGCFPSTSQGLAALVTKPAGNPTPKDWRQLFTHVPIDAWGNAYRYEQPGKHHPQGFDLYTTGGPRGEVMGNW